MMEAIFQVSNDVKHLRACPYTTGLARDSMPSHVVASGIKDDTSHTCEDLKTYESHTLHESYVPLAQ